MGRKNQGKFQSNGKGPKRNNSRQTTDALKSTEKVYASGTNDPAWYSKNPQLVKDVASFPFGVPVGTPFTHMGSKLQNPGIMVIDVVPTIGAGGGESDSINVAATNLYSFIRQANSGSRNYEPADLMMYLVALDSLYAFHARIKRLYGIANAYTPTNRYYPRGLIAGMGFDPDEVFANMAQLRALVNLCARQLASYRLPAHFTYIQRHQWMNSALFVDANSSKAQTYMFDQKWWWKYINTDPSGSKLQLTNREDMGHGNGLIADLTNWWRTLYEAIQNDEDVGVMSGDILKAFPNNILVVPEIDEGYTVLPVYDERVLMQIHNSTATGAHDNQAYAESTIVQDPAVNGGAITMNMYPQGAVGYYLGGLQINHNANHLLNFYRDDITPDDVMEATRLMAFLDDKGKINCCGSEVVFDYTIVCYADGTPGSMYTCSGVNVLNMAGNNTAAEYADVREYSRLISQFDWAPMTQLDIRVGSDHAGDKIFIGDIVNHTNISFDQLEMMHRVALLSEFEYY